MTDFLPPEFRAEARPEFSDAEGCAKWLQGLALANIPLAHSRLLHQIEELNGFRMSPAERLKILELLREPVEFVQTEQAKKFSYRPVLLPRPERGIFVRVIALWRAVSKGYQHGLQAIGAAEENADEMPGNAALLCQRVMECCQQLMACHYGIYQEIPGDIWSLAHRVAAYAEAIGITGAEAAHEGESPQPACAEIYAYLLLLNLANPHELAQREVALASPWIRRWASRVTLIRTPPAGGAGATSLAVDFLSGTGATRGLASGKNIRYLNVDRAVRSVRKRILRLRQGESPASLGLGEEASRETTERVLGILNRQWSREAQSRRQPRRSTSGTAYVCPGLVAIHAAITGGAFLQSGDTAEISTAQREEIAAFDPEATRRFQVGVDDRHAALETWQIRDESLSGLRLQRIDPAASSRLFLGQLLAVRPADAKNFFLAQIRWLSVSSEFNPSLGASILPGIPSAIAICASGPNSIRERPVPALLLPGVAALQSPETLVLPAGWFRPKRVIEMYAESPRDIVLMEMVVHGSDYEQVTFSPS